MAPPLVPCDACARHLRADETRCPFCDAAHTPVGVVYTPHPRMSRAAMAALGAMITVVPVAALVEVDEADAQTHASSMRPLYGLPPRRLPPQVQPRDASVRADASVDAGAPRDRGIDAGSPRRAPPRPHRPEPNIQPMYGVPPKP